MAVAGGHRAIPGARGREPRRAEAAHGAHEKRTGVRDADWPDWYAEYIAAEQAGRELPQ